MENSTLEQQALELRISGMTLPNIAKTLGVTTWQAHKLVNQALDNERAAVP